MSVIRLAIGVDPGLRIAGLGIADVRDGTILHGQLVKNYEMEDDGAAAWLGMSAAVQRALNAFSATIETGGVDVVSWECLALERMVVRFGFGKRTVQPNALMSVAAVCGAVTANTRARHKVAIYPAEWNKNLPKECSTARVWASLGLEERALTGVQMKGEPWMDKKGRECAEWVGRGDNVLDACGLAKFAADVARKRLALE